MKKEIIVVAALIIVAACIYFFLLHPYLTLPALKEYSVALRLFAKANPILSVVLYIAAYVCAALCAFPIVALLTITGGFLFGTYYAVVYATIGATIGAISAFLLTRYFFGNWLQVKFAFALHRFNQELELHGSSYLLSVRLIALIPFFLVNVCAGLTRVPLSLFIITTTIGIIPAECVFAFAGNQLATIDSMSDVFSYNVVGALLLLAVLALLPVIFKKIMHRHHH